LWDFSTLPVAGFHWLKRLDGTEGKKKLEKAALALKIFYSSKK